MLQNVVNQLLDVPPWIALLIIAALVFGEAALFVGFVLPGETAVVYGGVLAEAGKVSVLLVLAIVIVAAVVGDSVGFELGRVLGPRLVRAPSCAHTSSRSRRPRPTCVAAVAGRW